MPKKRHTKEERERLIVMGHRIRSAREAIGLKSCELAEKVDVAPATVSGWEHGRYAPSDSNLDALVKITGQSSAYLRPERLPKRGESIDWLSRDLGAALGKVRLKKLVEIPQERLRRAIDTVLGSEIVYREERRSIKR